MYYLLKKKANQDSGPSSQTEKMGTNVYTVINVKTILLRVKSYHHHTKVSHTAPLISVGSAFHFP